MDSLFFCFRKKIKQHPSNFSFTGYQSKGQSTSITNKRLVCYFQLSLLFDGQFEKTQQTTIQSD